VRGLIRCSAAALALSALGLSAQAPQRSADLVVLHAKLVTVDGSFRIVQAAAIRDGRFVAVGSDDDVRRLVGPQTRTIDARGRTVLPGLIESHSHASGVARGEANDPYEEMTSIPGIQAWVRHKASERPEGSWIVVPRSYPTRLKERRFPTRAELDAAAPRHAVVFDAAYCHVLNTLALAGAGIRKGSPNLAVGEIVRDADGNPTGLLRNAGAVVSRALPPANPPRERVMEQLEKLHRVYSSVGITSIVERGAGVNDYRMYEELRAAGRLALRTRFTLRLQGATAAEAEKFIRDLPVGPNAGDEWLRAGPLKLVVDGGILIGTAYMREPYGPKAVALYNLSDPDYRGSLSLRPETIKELLTLGHRLGWQMASHVTGDAGVDLVLDGVEAAGNARPIEGARYNLIHAYFPNDATIARARKLGVYVDTQPAWYYKDADALLPALGPERMNRFVGARDWLAAGVPVVANTDHMLGVDPNRALNPFNPFLTMYVLVTRKTESGQVIGPDQKVSREDALRMMTRTAAAMTFDDVEKGSIEVGKLGDFVVLPEDYLTCPPDRIKEIRPDLTVVAGRVVYTREMH
jgi:predicted amidohydrolase YtcJ